MYSELDWGNMATAIVSGRVEENVKRIAEIYIRRSGLTATDVIANVWGHIAATGEVPVLERVDDSGRQKAATVAKLAELRACALWERRLPQ